MKLSAPVSSNFPLQRAAPTRTSLMTGLLIPGVGLNQHPLWTSAYRTLSKTGHKIPCQKSQVAKPNKEGAPSKRVRIIGQAAIGGAGRQPKPNARPPCHVGLNQHILRLSHIAMSVSAGKTKQSRCPPNAGSGSAVRHPARSQIILAPRARAQGIPVRPRFRMNPAMVFFSSVDRPPTAMGSKPCNRSDSWSRGKLMIITFTRPA